MVKPDETWRTGHLGHVDFKQCLKSVPPSGLNGLEAQDIPVFKSLYVSNMETPLTDAQVVNMIAGLSKSQRHLSWILDHPFEFEYPAWANYKGVSRDFEAFCERFERLGRHVKVHRENGVTISLEVALFKVQKPLETVCAGVRRMVNLLEWSAGCKVLLKSGTPFKWKSFDSITSQQKLS